MDILLMMWTIIDIILITIFPLRKKVVDNGSPMYKKSIENRKSYMEKFIDEIFTCLGFALGIVIIYTILCFFPKEIIQGILKMHGEIVTVCLLPPLYACLNERKIKVRTIWDISLIILLIIFSVIGFCINEKIDEAILTYGSKLNLLISAVLTNIVIIFFKIKKINKVSYSKKLFNKGIRKDLYYRTPKLIVNIPDIELVRYCEKYFSEYYYRYKKIKDLNSVEYVNLSGIYCKLWYEKTAYFMKIFTILSFFSVIISIFGSASYKQFLIVVLIIIFGNLIVLYKRIEPKCLYRMGIRYFYDDWGYYLTCTKENKFVGTVQLVSLSKFHSYIHSFLDIVALCRAVSVNDKLNKEQRISIITCNLSELFINYTDYNIHRNWVMVLPLWIAALFEFNVTNQISEDVKLVLQQFVNEGTKIKISIFLQSFWAEQQGEELKNHVTEYISLFQKELYA